MRNFAAFQHLCLLIVTNHAFSQTQVKAADDRTGLRAYVTNFGEDTVSVIDPSVGSLVATIQTGRKPHGVALAPDGTALFVSNEGENTVCKINPRTNQVERTLKVFGVPNQLTVSADGKIVLVTLYDRASVGIIVVGNQDMALQREIPVGRAPHIVLRSPDGSRHFVTAEKDMLVTILDGGTFQPTAEIPLLALPRVLAPTPDGTGFYQTIRWLNGALLVDIQQKKVVDRVALGEERFAAEGKDAHGIAVSPDGKELWLTTQTTNAVSVINTENHQLKEIINVGKNPNWIEISRDGNIAIVSNTDSNDICVIDTKSRRIVHTIPVGSSPKRLAIGAVSLL
jgi:YVTN family beta-propeller protein